MPFLGITGVSPSALEDDYRKDCENEMKELSEEVVNKLSKAGNNNTTSSYKIKNKLENGSIIDVLNNQNHNYW